MTTLTPNYTFGAEIECIMPAGMTRAMLAHHVTAASGVTVNDMGYTHAHTPTWKAVRDGSLWGGEGVELVSPVLSGDAGLQQVRAICAALTSIGCKINNTCGFHVHVGIANETTDTVKRIYELYASYEESINSILPRERHSNNFCKSFKPELARILAAQTATDIANHFERRYRGSARYFSVNPMAYRRHRTIEFRQHSGTINPDKAVNWIKLMLLIVQAAANNKRPVQSMQSIRPVTLQTRRVIEMMMRPEGASRAEINASCGTADVNVSSRCRKAGVTVIRRRVNGENRFYVQSATLNLDNLMATIEADDDLKAFYAARAAQVAARNTAAA